MIRDKQTEIEEMVMVLTESQHAFDRAWKECLHNNAPTPDRENVFYAKYLVEKEGYRKTSDIAREIFEKLETRPHYKLINGAMHFMIRVEDYLHYKKKYTEGGK